MTTYPRSTTGTTRDRESRRECVRKMQRAVAACARRGAIAGIRGEILAELAVGFRRVDGTMTRFRQRSRLVTFRVSTEEYDDLSKWSRASGAPSISEFARAAVRQNVQSLRVPPGTLTGDLATLVRALGDLDTALSDTQKRIRGVLGSARSEDNHSPDQNGAVK